MEIESNFRLPPLAPTRTSLERHFAGSEAAPQPPLENYHRESPVDTAVRASATPAAVLIPIVQRAEELHLLLTRRHEDISYPLQVCFPGGRCDPDDGEPEETALREAEEEIGLDRESVTILGRLGDYHTQSGFRITPIVSLVTPPLSLTAAPREVTEILEIPLSVMTRADSYRLWQPDPDRSDAYFSLNCGEVNITGPTVCLFMGFYETLVGSHT